ncbi:MAG: diacylglycerol kinase family lipid kinase [Chloroflexia bacterium]|nr:diacylglycerol kinase family lipid kinase [Chloroflexia bacterium]
MSVGPSASSDPLTLASTPADRLHVIVNPASGNGRGRKRWPRIADSLGKHGFNYEVVFTSGPNHASEIARDMAAGGAHTIVAVGGDGTVNEIVNGLLHNDIPVNDKTRLVVIPCGTGKDLGRTLGTGSPEAAASALRANSTTLMDIGRIRFQTMEGHTETRYFANVADLGLGAEVAGRINHSSKALGGLVTYLAAAVRTIISFQPREITVDIGGDRVFHAPANMVVLANGQFFAGGMRVAPTASIRDGLLEMYILADVGKRALLTSLLPRVYRGKHVGQHGVLHIRAGSAAILCPAGMLMEMDGEQIGRSPIQVDVLPRILPVVGDPDALRAAGGCADGAI